MAIEQATSQYPASCPPPAFARASADRLADPDNKVVRATQSNVSLRSPRGTLDMGDVVGKDKRCSLRR